MRILLVEDSSDDELLLEEHLRSEGLAAEIVRVESPAAMGAALAGEAFDLIISDYNVPGFGARPALALLQQSGLDLPFIIVSGTVGEERAVDMMRAGARDYVMKQNLSRLVPAIRRELQETAFRRRQRATEKLLDEMRERFQATFEQVAVGIAHMSLDAQFIDVNEKLAEMLACAPVDLVGTLAFDWIQPDDRAASRSTYARLLEGTFPHVHTEHTMLGCDGGSLAVSTTTSVVTDEHGVPMYLIAIFQDISERKRSEELARHEASLLAATLEATADAIVVVDFDGRILKSNRGFGEMFGFPAEPPSGGEERKLFELVMREVKEQSLFPEFESLQGDVARDQAGSAELLDGRVIEWYTAPQLLDGVPIGRVWSFRDITSHVRAQQESNRLSRDRQLLLDSAAEGIFGIDREGVCTFVNHAASAILGYSSDELVGASTHDLLHQRRFDGTVYPPAECPTLGTARNGTQSASRTFYRRKDGSLITVDCIASPVIDEGSIRGAVVLFSDVSERVALERKVEQSQRVLTLGRVAATVAHEFNNVLMGIAPFGDLVRRLAGGNARLLSAADHIAASVQRGRRVTEEILRFTNHKQPAFVPVDLRGALSALVDELRPTLPRDCHIELAVGESPLYVTADAQQLEQVVVNLILNARDAMNGRGTIALRLDPHCSSAAVRHLITNPLDFVDVICQDTGSGIPSDQLEHIFEPLFTTKRNGTGLGLAVAQQVVTQHGGEVIAESQPGAGATFHVVLPLAKRQSAASAASSA